MSTNDEQRGLWNERYATQGLVWGADANRFVVAELSGLTPRRVLDLGCGQGRNAIWLALQGHDVTGIDLSDVAVEHARSLAAEHGVEARFEAADLVEWRPEPGSFDLVVLSYLQLPPQMRAAVHAKAVEALAPGGRVFLVAHHRDNLEHGIGGPPVADVLFDEAMLAGDFAGLEIVRNDRVLRPAEKDGVAGDAIDVLFIADKPTS